MNKQLNDETELKVGISFLEENLKKHLSSKDYCVIGTKSSNSAFDVPYVSYGFRVREDLPQFKGRYSGLHYCLKKLIEQTDEIINGLVLAKTCEKPEGRETKLRRVEVHFRSFPELSYIEQTFDKSAELILYMRLVAGHSIGEE